MYRSAVLPDILCGIVKFCGVPCADDGVACGVVACDVACDDVA